ncbi:hypothetical protein ABC270_16745 [Curtobacterium sp. 1P10AnD]|uniref:hypothetical protein n=1 Tax=Curtobacterium sp. 1P10AnD TaxID=3132283 RepID=UPI0039A0D345
MRPVPDGRAARSLVESRLDDGEELLWVGGSDPARVFVDADRWLIPLSVLFLAGIAVADVAVLRSGADPVTAIVLVALSVAAAHVLAGRFLVKRHRKRTDVYAVTDRRVLVVNERRVRETSASRTDWYVDRSGSHVTVEWDDSRHLDTLFPGGSEAVRQYANTGLDLTPGRGNFALYDVADGEALLAALHRTRSR